MLTRSSRLRFYLRRRSRSAKADRESGETASSATSGGADIEFLRVCLH
jgi:hypothetical protein